MQERDYCVKKTIGFCFFLGSGRDGLAKKKGILLNCGWTHLIRISLTHRPARGPAASRRPSSQSGVERAP
jgi:hypothetical protein